MNITLDYLTGNRKWLIRDYTVWGDAGSLDGDLMLTEYKSGENRVVFMHEYSGGNSQIVDFADLLDHRGNQLPTTINKPLVIIIPKNQIGAFILGAVGPTSFRIARKKEEPSNSLVDLLILEMN